MTKKSRRVFWLPHLAEDVPLGVHVAEGGQAGEQLLVLVPLHHEAALPVADGAGVLLLLLLLRQLEGPRGHGLGGREGAAVLQQELPRLRVPPQRRPKEAAGQAAQSSCLGGGRRCAK